MCERQHTHEHATNVRPALKSFFPTSITTLSSVYSLSKFTGICSHEHPPPSRVNYHDVRDNRTFIHRHIVMHTLGYATEKKAESTTSNDWKLMKYCSWGSGSTESPYKMRHPGNAGLMVRVFRRFGFESCLDPLLTFSPKILFLSVYCHLQWITPSLCTIQYSGKIWQGL